MPARLEGPADEGVRIRMVALDHVARLSGAEINLLKVVPRLGSADTTVVLGEDGDLAVALRDRGVPVVIVPLDRGAAGISASQGGIGSLARGALAFAGYGFRLRRTLRPLRPQLLYTNSSKAHLYGALAAALLRVPLVCHVHDRLTRDTYSRASLALLRFVFAWCAAGLIANSASTAQTLPRRAAGRTVALPCPVDPAEPEPQPRAQAEGLRFAVVGRISPWKGQDLAVRAFAAWAARTGRAGRLRIVGGALFGEDEYLEALTDLIQELGLEQRVELVGHIAPDAITRELAATDVLLHTSRIPEPFGQVVLEGMQAGVAVVAAAEGGPAELVRNGIDGLLYRMGDESALVDAMALVSESPELRARIGREAVLTARQYEAPVIVPRYMSFFRRIAARR